MKEIGYLVYYTRLLGPFKTTFSFDCIIATIGSTSISYYRVYLGVSFLSFVIFGEHISFNGPQISLFWSSGNVSSGFQSQCGQPYWYLAGAYVIYIICDSPLV